MTKEKIESEMLLIQLERIKIRDERNLIINQLQNVGSRTAMSTTRMSAR